MKRPRETSTNHGFKTSVIWAPTAASVRSGKLAGVLYPPLKATAITSEDLRRGGVVSCDGSPPFGATMCGVKPPVGFGSGGLAEPTAGAPSPIVAVTASSMGSKDHPACHFQPSFSLRVVYEVETEPHRGRADNREATPSTKRCPS